MFSRVAHRQTDRQTDGQTGPIIVLYYRCAALAYGVERHTSSTMPLLQHVCYGLASS